MAICSLTGYNYSPMAENGRNRANSWAQPSLSRDFALLSAAIVFIMVLISAWVTWITYVKHSERIVFELEKETARIERTLASELSNTGYMLTGIGRQIVNTQPRNVNDIAQILQSFAKGNPIFALWSWSDPKMNVLASSSTGVLDEPVDVSDRDYVYRSVAEPWVMHIGVPTEGRVSGRWIIPIGLGISDNTGKYLGTLGASIDVGVLSTQISHLVKRDGISFAVYSKSFVPLTIQGDDNMFPAEAMPMDRLRMLDTTRSSRGLISQGGLFSGNDLYSYYLISADYPYIIVVAYDNVVSDSAIRSLLWPRLTQIAVVAGFLLAFLGIIRSRVIKPVVELSAITNQVAGGGQYRPLSKAGPLEIEQLSYQVRRIGDYLHERKLVEQELLGKLGTLQRQYQRAQAEVRQRAALLSGLLGEYKQSLRSINGYAQVMKDQLYGPLENKKYKQYAADIHQSGTTLELMVRKLIALSRVDAAAVLPREETMTLFAAAERAKVFAVEGAQEAGGAPPVIQLDLDDAEEWKLRADGAHVRQGIGYALLYKLAARTEGQALHIHCRTIAMGKADHQSVLLIGYGDGAAPADADILTALDGARDQVLSPPAENGTFEQLHLFLAQAMLQWQRMPVALVRADGGSWLAIGLPSDRLTRVTESEREEV